MSETQDVRTHSAIDNNTYVIAVGLLGQTPKLVALNERMTRVRNLENYDCSGERD